MKRIIASSVGLLAIVGAAYAAETEGTVRAVDPATRTIMLDSGLTFNLSEDVRIEDLAAGARVRVIHDDGSTTATAVEAIS